MAKGPYSDDEEKANKLVREGLKKHGDGRFPGTDIAKQRAEALAKAKAAKAKKKDK